MGYNLSNPLDQARTGRVLAKRNMGPHLVIQRGLRTPTGRLFASFCIVGIRGLGFGFASTRRSTRRIAPFSGAR
jgi:hypothetical protein